jgi:hypothetical protein
MKINAVEKLHPELASPWNWSTSNRASLARVSGPFFPQFTSETGRYGSVAIRLLPNAQHDDSAMGREIPNQTVGS